MMIKIKKLMKETIIKKKKQKRIKTKMKKMKLMIQILTIVGKKMI